jgi:hypothetical protein
MRTNEVRDALIAAIEAIEPDKTVTQADRFYLMPADIEELKRDRAFTVRFSSLPVHAGRLTLAVDSVDATLDVVAGYLSQSEAAHTRIAQDADLILDALEELEADPTYPQIIRVEVLSGDVQYVDPGAGMLLSYAVRIEFDPRDP